MAEKENKPMKEKAEPWITSVSLDISRCKQTLASLDNVITGLPTNILAEFKSLFNKHLEKLISHRNIIEDTSSENYCSALSPPPQTHPTHSPTRPHTHTHTELIVGIDCGCAGDRISELTGPPSSDVVNYIPGVGVRWEGDGGGGGAGRHNSKDGLAKNTVDADTLGRTKSDVKQFQADHRAFVKCSAVLTIDGPGCCVQRCACAFWHCCVSAFCASAF